MGLKTKTKTKKHTMKKQLLLTAVLALAFSANSFAQLNAGFEAWSSPFQQPKEPNNWITANTFASPLLTFPNPNPNPTSAFRDSTPAYAGVYSMKLVTIDLAYNPDTNTIPDRLGVAVQGSITVTPSFTIKDRIPFTGRPSNVAFAAKYTPVSTDSAFCFFELTKWNTSLMQRDTIAWGFWYTNTTTTSYQVYNITPFYNPLLPNAFPDSMYLSFSSSSFWFAQAGSALYADGINLTGWNSTNDEESLSDFVKVYPNPVTESVTISAELESAKQVILYDGLGRKIGMYALKDQKVIINTTEFPEGSYFYSLTDANGKVLTGGNFNVAK